jgi:hypothetical protein
VGGKLLAIGVFEILVIVKAPIIVCGADERGNGGK